MLGSYTTIVIDYGTFDVKSGYGGQESPHHVIPSLYCTIPQSSDTDQNSPFIFDQKALVKRKNTQFNPLFDDNSTPTSWDAFEAMTNHLLDQKMGIDPKDSPVLFSEPSNLLNKTNVEKYSEIFFESLSVPALWNTSAPVLAALSHGKQTALIVDIGHSGTTVTPVYQGYSLRRSIRSSNIGGKLFDKILQYCIEKNAASSLSSSYILSGNSKQQKGTSIGTFRFRPRYEIEKKPANSKSLGPPFTIQYHNHPKVHESYRSYCINTIIQNIKETTCSLSPHNYSSYSKNRTIPYIPFHSYDGFILQVGGQRYQAVEPLFQPTSIPEDLISSLSDGTDISETTQSATALQNTKPPPQVPTNSFSSSSPDASSSTTTPMEDVVMESTTQEQKDAYLQLQQYWIEKNRKLALLPPSYQKPLPELIRSSILSIDDRSTQKALLNQIILVGGSSLLPGLRDRLNAELTNEMLAYSHRIFQSSSPLEQKYAAWNGGSLLASLPSYHQMWFSKYEYEEFGVSFASVKSLH